MELASGTKLGQFEVVSPLGKGGMGEVYLARDSRLSREVALKILPEALASNADRVARFEREARVLASLNHPHIAAVHGLEQADGVRFLVLELVPGPTLGDRLASGALEVREALQLARQIAEGLEEAHAKGVIHRDLKPANIKITPEGRVKVLDFGLAKALDESSDASPDDSPTVARAVESAGVILGTAGYMSPEQARGQIVDKRSDIWAFGCVLYEMLVGQRLFSGPSATDTLAAVLTVDPDWSRLPARTPPGVRSLLRRCLQKEKSSRVHDISDARIEIEDALREESSGVTPVTPAPSSRPRRQLFSHAVALVIGALVGAGVVLLVRSPAPSPGTAAVLNINLPGEGRLLEQLSGVVPVALSRDVKRLAYVGRRADGRTQIFLRRMDRLNPEPVPGTEDAEMPFLSPDGEWLGFASEGKLKKVLLSGGQPVVITEAPDPRGASWGDDGTILLAPNNAGGLFRVRATGGDLEPATQIDRARSEDGHRWPRLLPGGKAALFSVQPLSGRESQRKIDALNLVTGERKTLIEGGSYPVYASGLLFYGRGGQILAVPFDPERLEVQGEPEPVLDDVRMDTKNTGLVHLDVSPEGTAVYVAGFPKPRERSLVFMDRAGRQTPVTSTNRPFFSPVISPDGRRIAVVIEGSEEVLWVMDLESETMNRLTFDVNVSVASWSADGRSIFYAGNADGPRSVYKIAADGSGKAELVFSKTEWWINDFSVRPDGSGILMAVQDVHGHDLMFLPTGKTEVEPFLVAPSEERGPAFSPDGRYVVYASDESNRFEIYLRPFPGPGPKRQISNNGGVTPSWSRDGREIFYWEPSRVGRLNRVSFEPGPDPKVGKPQTLFEVPLLMIDRLTLTPDGQRFAMVQPPPEEETPLSMVAIPGFLEETKARLSARRR
ncbi:MAG TPA: protein kinase [Vicinamibacteria bacterium]|nr:protein kinase [Vicinamibacteria bacterium]